MISVIAFAFMGFNIYSSSMFTSFGDGKTSAILSFFRTLLLRLVCITNFFPNIGRFGRVGFHSHSRIGKPADVRLLFCPQEESLSVWLKQEADIAYLS